ncbi:helix-turn-helix domain-containing protein [uncultured Mediterraneibacter sp.]|nr:helix-turn-helix transcriptional regulator [uncultured Mediterraneibacter sp.]
MTQGERIKQVRKSLNMTMDQFGGKIGVTKSTISNIENGNRNATEHMLKSICREFRVNYFWLTEEKGEPFIDIPDTALDDLADDYDLDNIDKKIIQKYLELSADQRDVIKAYLRSLCEDEKNG